MAGIATAPRLKCAHSKSRCATTPEGCADLPPVEASSVQTTGRPVRPVLRSGVEPTPGAGATVAKVRNR